MVCNYSQQSRSHISSISAKRITFAKKINGDQIPTFKSSTSHLPFCRLPKIKDWIDTNNPGDPLIPFSVSLEERLVSLSPEEKKEEETKVGVASALPKITQAGYSSLDVGSPLFDS